MKRCPFSPKGQRGAHDLAVVCPPDDIDIPLMLACVRCGNVVRHELRVVPRMALDDLPADVIARLARHPGA